MGYQSFKPHSYPSVQAARPYTDTGSLLLSGINPPDQQQWRMGPDVPALYMVTELFSVISLLTIHLSLASACLTVTLNIRLWLATVWHWHKISLVSACLTLTQYIFGQRLSDINTKYLWVRLSDNNKSCLWLGPVWYWHKISLFGACLTLTQNVFGWRLSDIDTNYLWVAPVWH